MNLNHQVKKTFLKNIMYTVSIFGRKNLVLLLLQVGSIVIIGRLLILINLDETLWRFLLAGCSLHRVLACFEFSLGSQICLKLSFEDGVLFFQLGLLMLFGFRGIFLLRLDWFGSYSFEDRESGDDVFVDEVELI